MSFLLSGLGRTGPWQTGPGRSRAAGRRCTGRWAGREAEALASSGGSRGLHKGPAGALAGVQDTKVIPGGWVRGGRGTTRVRNVLWELSGPHSTLAGCQVRVQTSAGWDRGGCQGRTGPWGPWRVQRACSHVPGRDRLRGPQRTWLGPFPDSPQPSRVWEARRWAGVALGSGAGPLQAWPRGGRRPRGPAEGGPCVGGAQTARAWGTCDRERPGEAPPASLLPPPPARPRALAGPAVDEPRATPSALHALATALPQGQGSHQPGSSCASCRWIVVLTALRPDCPRQVLVTLGAQACARLKGRGLGREEARRKPVSPRGDLKVTRRRWEPRTECGVRAGMSGGGRRACHGLRRVPPGPVFKF